MVRKSLLASVALALAVSALPARAALDWSDNAFRYTWGQSFSEPGVRATDGSSRTIAKNIVAFTHVDGYKFGGNYLNINMLLSTSEDPANRNPGQGATEFYAIYRHDLSLAKLTHSKAGFGPIRDVFLEAGIDYSTKNTAFAPHKVMPVVGPGVALKVPGFWNVAVLANKEWNNNGVASVKPDGTLDFTKGSAVEFDTTVMLATSWGIPLLSLPVSFEGFGSLNLPKGKDGFNRQTKSELLLHPKLMWDVGTHFATKGYQVGVGYEYWMNKFGNDRNLAANWGAEQSTFLVEAAFHL